MKQQQSQMQGAHTPSPSQRHVEVVAMRNFEAKNIRRDRAWSRDQAKSDSPVYVLSERERSEFIEQARYEVEMRARRGRTRSGPF
jgi:hypothetical protein